MPPRSTRREFVSAVTACGLAFGTGLAKGAAACPAATFKISLAQWSLHRRIIGSAAGRLFAVSPLPDLKAKLRYTPGDVLKGGLTTLEFPRTARREFGIGAVDYVNTFMFGRARDARYLKDLKIRAEGEGVYNHVIMCDFEGDLGAPVAAERERAVHSHHQWVEAAAVLGCRFIRVNAASAGSWDEQVKLAADGLHRLADYAGKHDVSVLVENHGGLSSNGRWLAEVIKFAAHPRLGTLPDFGNFAIDESSSYDPYRGVTDLMPFAGAVSAKSYDFDADGNETTFDYDRMLRIVREAGFSGYVSVEYEGHRLSEADGIRATKAILERVRGGWRIC